MSHVDALAVLDSLFFSHAVYFHSSSPLPRMHPLPFTPSLVSAFFVLILEGPVKGLLKAGPCFPVFL